MKEKDDTPGPGRTSPRRTGTRLAELEGIIAEEDGYAAEAAGRRAAPGPRHRQRLARPAHEEPGRRLQAARAAGPGALRQAPGAAARRADQQPRPRLDPLAGAVPPRLRGRAHHHQPRPPLPQRHLHPHRRHRLRDHHHLHRAATTTWSGRRGRSGTASSRRTPRRRRRSPSSRTSWPASHAGTRASQVQSRIRADPEAQARRHEALQHRRPPSSSSSGRRRAAGRRWRSRDLEKRFHGNEVIQPFTALVTRGEKIAVIGQNGVGQVHPGEARWSATSSPTPGSVEVGAPGRRSATCRRTTPALIRPAPPPSAGCASRRTSSPTRRSPACSGGCSSPARSA